MIELYMLIQLVAIAENGTISKAAEQLHISQPALSRTINKLEDILDVKLFERSKNKVTLNENGLLAVKYAKKVLAASNELMDKVRSFDESRRTITMLSCAPAPMWVLEEILKDMFPAVTIKSSLDYYENMEEMLLSEKCDILILPYAPENDKIKSAKIFEERLLLSVPPAHPLAAYPEISLSDLEGETMLLYSELGYWHDMHKKQTPNTHYILQTEYESMTALVRASALPSFVSNITLDIRKDPNRVTVPIRDEAAKAEFYCCWRKAEHRKFKGLAGKLCEEEIGRVIDRLSRNEG